MSTSKQHGLGRKHDRQDGGGLDMYAGTMMGILAEG